MRNLILIFLVLIVSSCNNSTDKTTPKDSVVYAYDKISGTRKTINPNALKTYEETVKSFETTDEFKVSLFETNQTFKFLIKISYKNLTAEDTLDIPNFGQEPAVHIIRGDSIRPSCIVGFLDADKNFKESKLVYFEDSMLKTHVLKYYGVFSK